MMTPDQTMSEPLDPESGEKRALLRFRQIHLDFHTSEQILSVGERFDADEFARTLKNAAVDSINLFAWCHHGQLYYDSPKFPELKHPGLKFDLLDAQLDACHAHDIKAPIYVTVGWDEYVVHTHPEWIERDTDGKPFGAGPLEAGWKKLCLNTPYVDYFETRLADVMEKFTGRLDGMWIDIVFQDPCCCNWCLREMLEQGLDPEREADRWTQAGRVLLRFKQRITRFIRQFDKDCQIFYNAGHIGPYVRTSLDAYTHLELESLPGSREIWGYEHFPIAVRFARTLGLPYIGMTAKFHKMWGDFGGFKNPAALECECFTIISQGAQCCIGDQLHPRGRLDPATYDLVGGVYRQIEQKEPWCAGAQAVTEIGLFTPEPPVGHNHYALNPPIRGAFRMLVESHHQFDVIDAQSDFSRYPLLILPDLITLDEALRDKLAEYLASGGKALFSYHSGLDPKLKGFVLEELGLDYVGESEFRPEFFRPCHVNRLAATEYVLYDRGTWVSPRASQQTLARLWRPYFNRSYKHFCSHFHAPAECESGYPAALVGSCTAYLSHPLFAMYHQYGANAYKRLALEVLCRLLSDKLVRTNAPSTAHINLNWQPEHQRHVAHVLHYIPEGRSKETDVIEDVIPLYQVELDVKLSGAVRRVYLAPTGEELTFESSGEGRIRTVVPEVRGHAMVVFE